MEKIRSTNVGRKPGLFDSFFFWVGWWFGSEKHSEVDPYASRSALPERLLESEINRRKNIPLTIARRRCINKTNFQNEEISLLLLVLCAQSLTRTYFYMYVREEERDIKGWFYAIGFYIAQTLGITNPKLER